MWKIPGDPKPKSFKVGTVCLLFVNPSIMKMFVINVPFRSRSKQILFVVKFDVNLS